MKVFRGRVSKVAGFLVTVRTERGKDLSLDCGLAFTAFKAGDAVTLFGVNGRMVRAVSERTGMMIRLDAINDLEQALPKGFLLGGAIPFLGAKFSISYLRHCWSRRHQAGWAWQVWSLPAVLMMLVTALLFFSVPPDARMAQAGWVLTLGVASSIAATAIWPGLLMVPHVLIERLRAAVTDSAAERALLNAPAVDWSSEALTLPDESNEAPFDMSFLDQPVEDHSAPAESKPSVSLSETKVVSMPPTRALDRLSALSEKTAAIQSLCEELIREHQAIRKDLLSSKHSTARDRAERRARI